YKQATGGVIEAAQLYLWNIQAASAVTELTGLAEVLLRDTIDTRLRAWNATVADREDWIVHPAPTVLKHQVRPDVPPSWKPRRAGDLYPQWWEKKALDNYDARRPGAASSAGPPPTHDDLVASLNFGSWTSILPTPQAGRNNNRVKIWDAALSSGFTGVRREAVYRYAHELRWMRNRAAHLRPMLNTDDLWVTHRYAIRLLRSMDTDFAQIIAGQAVLPTIIKAKPRTSV
ncbi:hypothetical protein, partial [Corynebacterium kalidii]